MTKFLCFASLGLALLIVSLGNVHAQTVVGRGTPGQLTKWTGFNGSNYTVGDSLITETKSGRIGIGTTTPTSTLTVIGMIETTLGGIKFPDGTVQTTAAVGGLVPVQHDTTLTGNGTAASPLGVAVPLTLSGVVGFNPILRVQNLGTSGPGVIVTGGFSDSGRGGTGVNAVGGNTDSGIGGHGVFAFGGISNSGDGGFGVNAVGGNTDSGVGGKGVEATGGFSDSGAGGTGVFAIGGDSNSGAGGAGVLAFGGSGFGGIGPSGAFGGDVQITGNLNVSGSKNFKIDDPLDPENKYLLHAAIESSEVLNLYSGNVKLDANGEASIELPVWFQALNRDFRYSLTPVGAPGAGLYVAQEIADNRFKIAGGTPGMKVSWQVTGVRSDPGMLKHPFKVEEAKPERERGSYLDPDAYGQPEERGTEWARHPEMMQRMKEQRLKQMEEIKQKRPQR